MAAPRKIGRVDQDKPVIPKVSLDLDALEVESDYEPFTFKHGGRIWQFKDASDMDYKVLMTAQQRPDLFIKGALPDGDWQEFNEMTLPLRKLAKLTTAYLVHYGIGDDQGESGALST